MSDTVTDSDQRSELLAQLDSEIAILEFHRHQLDHAAVRCDEQEAKIMAIMANLRLKSHVTGDRKVTMVARERPRYNEVGLKKALGAKLWNKVTKRVLDKSKLEKLVNGGEISLDTLAAHAQLIAEKPFLRLSSTQPE